MDMKARVLGLLRGTDLLIGTRQRLAREIADAHAVELQKALADQREGIAHMLQVTIGDVDGENQWYDGFRRGVHESADIVRSYRRVCRRCGGVPGAELSPCRCEPATT